MSEPASPSPFSRRTVAVLVVLGAVLALGFLVLSGFGGDLSKRLQRASGPQTADATGFKAFYRLIELTGGRAVGVVDRRDYRTRALLIVLPGADTRPQDLAAIVRARGSSPTLIVLPKWRTRPDPANRLRRQRIAPLAPYEVARSLGGLDRRLRVAIAGGGGMAIQSNVGLRPFVVPDHLQVMRGGALRPLIVAADGGVVLGQTGDEATYILADPDLLNNWGMRSAVNAQGATALVEAISTDGTRTVMFDQTLHMAPGERNLIRLMFEPPFVAVTIALIAAAVLAGIAAFGRFGPVRREPRAFAIGKVALLDTIAQLTRAAGRTGRSGAAYADAMRDTIARRARAARGLSGDALTAALDRLRAETPYSELDARLRTARTESELVRAAQALDDWRKDVKA